MRISRHKFMLLLLLNAFFGLQLAANGCAVAGLIAMAY